MDDARSHGTTPSRYAPAMRDGVVTFPVVRFAGAIGGGARAWTALACIATIAGCAGAPRPVDPCAGAAVAVRESVVESHSGPRALERHGLPARQLSGLVHWHGDRYLAIGDDGAAFLWELRIAIDGATGALSAAEVVGGIPLEVAPADGEALAWIGGRTRLLVADEEDSTILEYAIERAEHGEGEPARGATPARASFVARRPASPVFAPDALRPNLGLESLGAFDGATWCASEDARRDDGPCATVESGAWVRIERRDASGAPSGQWAYRTDPVPARALRRDLERSGVVDIVPVARDAALVLERAVGGAPLPTVRSRLYAIDARGAADVSTVAALADASCAPLAKRLLWELDAAGANFEGLATGPRLDDGRIALVLVADDGGGAMGQRALVRVLLWEDAGACGQRAVSPARPTNEK